MRSCTTRPISGWRTVIGISALCDVDKERLSTGPKLQLPAEQVYADYEEMLEKEQLDVVDIMVPIELNFQITEAAARRLAGKGKGIICEKPRLPTWKKPKRPGSYRKNTVSPS